MSGSNYNVIKTGSGTETLRSFTTPEAGTDADPDGDGLPNLVERALGLNPNTANANPIVLDQEDIGGARARDERAAAVHQRRDGFATRQGIGIGSAARRSRRRRGGLRDVLDGRHHADAR